MGWCLSASWVRKEPKVIDSDSLCFQSRQRTVPFRAASFSARTDNLRKPSFSCQGHLFTSSDLRTPARLAAGTAWGRTDKLRDHHAVCQGSLLSSLALRNRLRSDRAPPFLAAVLNDRASRPTFAMVVNRFHTTLRLRLRLTSESSRFACKPLDCSLPLNSLREIQITARNAALRILCAA